MKYWVRNSSETICHARIFDVVRSLCTLEDNSKTHEFHTINSAKWIHIIPIIKGTNNVVLVKQFRHGIEAPTLEFPGGLVDDGEDPKVAAIRELKEETGYVALSTKEIASFYPNPAIFSNTCYSYLASVDPHPQALSLDETESVEVIVMPFDKLLKDPLKYQFTNAVLLAGLYMYSISSLRM